MNSTNPFQIELLKLADGTRLLRVTDPVTETALERRVQCDQPVARQKETVLGALRAVLDRELKEPSAA